MARSVTMHKADNGYVVESYDDATMKSHKLVAEDEHKAMRHLARAMKMRKRMPNGKFRPGMPHEDLD